MALVLQNQVKWMVHRVTSTGAVGTYLGDFTWDDHERSAQQWAESNKKSLFGVNKKTKIKVFRRPANGQR